MYFYEHITLCTTLLHKHINKNSFITSRLPQWYPMVYTTQGPFNFFGSTQVTIDKNLVPKVTRQFHKSHYNFLKNHYMKTENRKICSDFVIFFFFLKKCRDFLKIYIHESNYRKNHNDWNSLNFIFYKKWLTEYLQICPA